MAAPELPELPELGAWPGLRLLARIEEGNRNDVWQGELDGALVAVRRSRRAEASLAWELDLIEALAGHRFTVATVLRAADGRRHVNGFVVQRWLDGIAPETSSDWGAVASTLQRLHGAPIEIGQRPGCLSVTEFDMQSRSVDADMAAIPEDIARELLDVFASVRDAPRSIIHGDAGASNFRMCSDGTVGLLDFDESRIDVSWHDLSELGVQVLDDDTHGRAQRLSNAWEAANAWIPEPDYARERLAALRAT